jgi:tRNA (guanine-N7-)-methyltransferase
VSTLAGLIEGMTFPLPSPLLQAGEGARNFPLPQSDEGAENSPLPLAGEEQGERASGASQSAGLNLETHHRAIRSFVTRAGRTTAAQARALAELGPCHVLSYDPATTDLVVACAGQAYQQTVLEIGFGMGQATAHIAALRPGTLFIGCEVHEPGVGALLKLIGEQGLDNVRIVRHDAVEVLQHMIAPATLHGAHVFFPDPWHKKRHHKRRLIQPPFVHLLAGRIAPGGYIHCATDWQPYAEQMLSVLAAEPLLTNTAEGYASRPAYRPETKFERRGLRLGHGVWDLVFTRVP